MERLGGSAPRHSFGTFPFPADPPSDAASEVEGVARSLVETRHALCEEHGIGLTALDNLVDEGAFRPLADLHRTLDAAVARCYRWTTAIADDPTAAAERLMRLNAAG